MDAFMNTLIKMSLRGVVIIFIVLLVRILLKKLRIGHKYILGLWAMAFLYFVFPWKLSLSVGFWNNAGITGIMEEMKGVSEPRQAENESYGEAGGTGKPVNPSGAVGITLTDAPATAVKDIPTVAAKDNPSAAAKDSTGITAAAPAGLMGQNPDGMDGGTENLPAKNEAARVTGFIWLAGLAAFSDVCYTPALYYSDAFVPVQAAEYSVDNNMTVLGRLEFGMSIEEVEDILSNAGMHTFRVDESVYHERYGAALSAEYSQYHCYFDNQNKLVRLSIQEGGSRDGRFTLGMSFSDLQKRVEEAGGSFAKEESDTPYEIWLYQDIGQQIQYAFCVYEGSVSVVDESEISGQS